MKYWCDGGTKWHNGEQSEAYGSYCDETGQMARLCFPQYRTNNEAEYATLLSLLESLQTDSFPTIYMDSRLVVNQISGEWKLKAQHLFHLLQACRQHVSRTGAFINWVPREKIVEKLGH